MIINKCNNQGQTNFGGLKPKKSLALALGVLTTVAAATTHLATKEAPETSSKVVKALDAVAHTNKIDLAVSPTNTVKTATNAVEAVETEVAKVADGFSNN